MKRFFKNLKAMALVAVVGVAAVSCAEAYDDTELKQQVADLAERVSKLEERLDSEVTALRALIDEKVALAEVQEDGAWKFTLADGKDLTLYPEYVENGLTVVTEDGVQYWAKVEGNVTTILTDANGNKVAFHNAPELRVNAENIIEVSVDGGKSWVATQAPSLFAAIDVKDNHACLTLQNGEVLKFALYEQVNFNVDGNALFVAPMESEKIALTLEGIVELIPLVIPEGWSVEIDGLVMTVTAPAASEGDEDDDMGMLPMPMPGGGGEKEVTPVIKVLAISKEGKAMVANLVVEVATDGAISLKVAGDDVIITNNKVTEELNWDTWEYEMVPADIRYTAFPTSEYTVEQAVKAINGNSFPYEIFIHKEAGVLTVAIDKLVSDCCEVEKIERGDSYTVIAYEAFNADYGESLDANKVMRATYVSTYVNVEIGNLTFKDAQLDILVEGYNGFKVVVYDTAYEFNAEEDMMLWVRYGSNYPWGKDFAENSFSGSLFDIDPAMIKPYANRTYAVYVLPLSAVKESVDYTFEEVLGPYTVKTKNYTAGGMLEPTFVPSVDEEGNERVANYQYFYAGIKPVAGTYRTHAWYFTAEALKGFADADLVNEVVAKGYVSEGEKQINLSNDEALAPGATVTVVAVSVDQDGKYGPIVKKEYSTKSVNYSAATIEITDWELNVTREMNINTSSYSFNVKSEGELANTYFYLIPWNQYKNIDKELASIAVDVVNGSLSDFIPLSDVAKNEAGHYAPVGKLGYSWSPKYMGVEYGKEYCLAIFGVDADGKPTKIAYKKFETFVPMTIVYADDAKWAASKPTLTIGEPEILTTMYESLKENWDFIFDMFVNQRGMTEEEAKQQMEMMVSYGELQDPEKLSAEEKAAPASLNIPFTVTPGAGAVKCLVEYNSDGNFDEVATRTWLDNMVANAEAAPADGKVSQHMVYEISAETTLTAQSVAGHISNYVYITWQDADGNWYEATENLLHKGLYEEE